MLTPYDTLEVICRRCLAGEVLKPDEMSWLGQTLAAFISRRCRTMEEAMHLRVGRGGVSWRREHAIRRRDAALRELARRFHGQQCVSAQARTIRVLAVRYAATGWRRDRRLTAPPLHYSDAPYELLWRAFASGAPMPIGERRLRGILAPAARPLDRVVEMTAPRSPFPNTHIEGVRPGQFESLS
jgi:hypothetical protein